MTLIEIRWHSRGGQGAWTASNILAEAAIAEGKHAQSFPTFGPERMGAPILTFTRISDEPIELHTGIYNPDIVVVLDPTLVKPNILEGLKEGGTLVLNFKGGRGDLVKLLGQTLEKYKVYTVPATDIAVEILGRGITNTAMLGALIKAVPLVKLETLLNIVKERFGGALGEKNIEVVRRAYNEVREVV